MITKIQESEVRDFLLKKKLNSVIFNEVYDHFVMQIFQLMHEGFSFQEAFLKTKINWNYELEMVKADLLSFKKIARIEKNILHNRFRNITIFSLLAAFVSLAFLLFFSDFFMYIQIGLLGILFSLLVYNFIFRKMKFRDYIELSFHPLLLKNLILLGILFYVTSYLTSYVNFWEFGINKAFSVFAIFVQLQLLYFRSKKINVLI